MPQQTITNLPFALTANGTDVFACQNNGANDIYLGTGPEVSPDSYDRLLDVGGEITWPTGKPLYAVCAIGLSSTLTYLNNGASGSSGSTRISGPVTVSGDVTLVGPVAVTGDVGIVGPVAVSGTVDISGPVTVQGSVGISGGNITVGSIVGAVSVTGSQVNVGVTNTSAALLATYNTAIPANTVRTVYDSGGTALLPYQTILVNAVSQGVGNANAETVINFIWRNAAGSITIATDTILVNSLGSFTIQLPIKAQRLYIQLITDGGGGAAFLPIQVAATATLLMRRVSQDASNVNRSPGLQLNGLTANESGGSVGWDVVIASGSGGVLFLPTISGRATLWFDVPVAIVTTVFLVTNTDQGSTADRIFYSATSAVTIINGQPLILPEAPLILVLQGGVGSRCIGHLTWEMT